MGQQVHTACYGVDNEVAAQTFAVLLINSRCLWGSSAHAYAALLTWWM